MDISPSSPDLIQPFEPPSPDSYWTDNYRYSQNFSPLTLMDNNSSDGNTMPSEADSRAYLDSPRSPSPSYHADSDEAILDSEHGSSPQSGRAFSPSDLLDWRHPLLPLAELPHSPAFGPMTAQDSLSAFVDGLSDTNPPLSPFTNRHSSSDSSPMVSDLGRMDDTHSSPSLDRPFSPMDLLVDNTSADSRAQFDHSYVRNNVRELTEQMESAARESARLETSLERVHRLAERVNSISSRLYGSSGSRASPELVAMRFYSQSPASTEPTGRASPLETLPGVPLSPEPMERPVRESVIRPGFDWSRISSPDIPSPPRRDSPMPDSSPRGLSPPGVWYQDRHSPVRYASPPLSPRDLSPAPAARPQPRYQLRSYTHTAARPRAPSPEVQEPAFLRFRRITERLRSPVDGERDRSQNAQTRSGVIISSRNSNPTSFISRLRRARLQTTRMGPMSPARVRTPPVHAAAVLPLPMEPVSLNNSTKKKISSKVKETMAKVGIDDGSTTARTSRALTPDSCSVCLEVPKPLDASLTYPCLHTFCNECISVWVQTKSSCPNCQAKVTRILYNLRGESDYDVKSVEDRNNLITAPPFDGDFFEFFFHLHQRVANRNQEHHRAATSTAIRPVREAYQVSEVFGRNLSDLPNALQQERILPGGFEVSRVSFRRAVYAQRLTGCSDRHTGFEAARDVEVPLEITTEMIQRPGCLRLLFPWLRREVMAAVLPEASSATREHVYAVISGRVNRPVSYDQFASASQDWLRDGRERVFWREMLQFLDSRIEMGVWDQQRRYFTPDGAVYDPASLTHAGHDEDVQVVDVVLRDPHRAQRGGRNVEVIVVDSDDDVSRSTNGRTIDSTQATNGTVDSDREMNWLPSETDTDATDYRENWARRHEEVETSDDAMETEEAPSRSHGESSRRRDTPDVRSGNAADEMDRLITEVIHSANSFHRRGQRGTRETLHRQEVSQPVRRRASESRAGRSPRYGRTPTATRSRRVRHGNRHGPYTSRAREDPADTDSEDAQPIPLRPRRLRTLRETTQRVAGAMVAGMERTARGDSPDPRRFRAGHAPNASERYHGTMGRLRSRRPRNPTRLE